MKLFLALLTALLVAPTAAHAQAPADSLAHPIATNCGTRLDPVGFVLGRADDLTLSQNERTILQRLADRVAAENRPLGSRFWAAAGTANGQEERKAVLFELRVNYKAALAEVRDVLGEERYRQAFAVAPNEGVEGQGVVRCLARAIPAIVGVGP